MCPKSYLPFFLTRTLTPTGADSGKHYTAPERMLPIVFAASRLAEVVTCAYMLTHPFDSGNSDCQTVLDQLYHAYAESHEHDPQEIGDGFKELEEYLCVLPLDNNNAVFNLCCRLCSAYERKAFLDGLQYGAELMLELGKESDR